MLLEAFYNKNSISTNNKEKGNWSGNLKALEILITHL